MLWFQIHAGADPKVKRKRAYVGCERLGWKLAMCWAILKHSELAP